MTEQYILVIDEGTTGTRALIVDRNSEIKAQVYTEFTQHHPAPDRVEHDAEEIWEATQAMVKQALTEAELKAATEELEERLNAATRLADAFCER